MKHPKKRKENKNAECMCMRACMRLYSAGAAPFSAGLEVVDDEFKQVTGA